MTVLFPGGPIAPVVSSALEAAHVLKGSAGSLYSVSCEATSVDGFLMLFDATSAPANGAVTPIRCIPVLAGNVGAFDCGSGPADSFAVGITAVFSTTGPFTKTSSATAFFVGKVV